MVKYIVIKNGTTEQYDSFNEMFDEMVQIPSIEKTLTEWFQDASQGASVDDYQRDYFIEAAEINGYTVVGCKK